MLGDLIARSGLLAGLLLTGCPGENDAKESELPTPNRPADSSDGADASTSDADATETATTTSPATSAGSTEVMTVTTVSEADDGDSSTGEADCPQGCNAPPGVCYIAPGTCVEGRCEYEFKAQSTPCEDGDLCTLDDECDGQGSCLSGNVLTCDRDNAENGTCSEGLCRGWTCVEPFENCDDDWDNGCEIPTGVPNSCNYLGIQTDNACGTAYCGIEFGPNAVNFEEENYRCMTCSNCSGSERRRRRVVQPEQRNVVARGARCVPVDLRASSVRAVVGAAVLLAATASCLGDVRKPGELADETSGGEASTTSSDGPTSASPTTSPASTTAAAEADVSSSSSGGDTLVLTTGSSSTTGGSTATELVVVEHEREFRGTWVATVFNINFPTASGLSADAQREEMLEILDVAASLNLNAVVLQVRPESDALYDSPLEPWSRFLSGTQGNDPGYDPLDFAVAEAHDRGIEVHAWINPFRAKTDNTAPTDPAHITEIYDRYALPYGTQTWMDPGAAEVRDHVVAVVVDLAERYAIDGIQTDDYYYPYDTAGPFPDDETWQAYLDGGGTLDIDDWRRDNINRLIEGFRVALLEAAPDVRLGAAPFGIYQPGVPPGITGFDQYNTLYADPVHWIQQGWVDFLTPQIYWATTQPQQDYAVLLEWWSSLPSDGQHVFAGNAAFKLGSGPEWDVDEFLLQVQLVRESGLPTGGNVFYNVDTLLEDVDGLGTALAESFYVRPALTPPLPRSDLPPVEEPQVVFVPGGVELDHAQVDTLRAYVIYTEVDGAFVVEDIVGPQTVFVPLSGGRFAVSAADRLGTESVGVAFDVP